MDTVCPIGFFCFNSQTVGLLIGILVMTIVFILYHKKSDLVVLNTLKDIKVDKIQKLETRLDDLERTPPQNNREIIVLPTNQSVLVNNDFERIVNPLLPPERSFNSTYRVPINIPTRGNSARYQQVGAINSGTEILPLFGRPRWPGAHRWNYYTSTDSFQSVKLPIFFKQRDCLDDNGCDEVYDGDSINIPQYGNERDFKANIYRLDKPHYVPFL